MLTNASAGIPQGGVNWIVQLSLNPEGAYFIGLKIGRRSAELVQIPHEGVHEAVVVVDDEDPVSHRRWTAAD